MIGIQHIAAAAVLTSLLRVGLVPGGMSGDEDVEIGRYTLGRSVMGSTSIYVNQLPSAAPDELNYDLMAACHIRCPGGTCDIEIMDDVNGRNVRFRVCFEGEEFCRPHVFFGSASVPGNKVSVVPDTFQGTRGIVYVR